MNELIPVNEPLLNLMESDDNAMINSIRQNTKIGRPCGYESFIKK